MTSAIERVRRNTLAAELVALSVVEHTNASDVRIRLRFTGPWRRDGETWEQAFDRTGTVPGLDLEFEA